MRFSRFLAVLLLTLAAAAQAADQPAYVTREAIGEAAIIGGNKERAFDEAKRQAMREAVEQVAGVLISSDTLTANSQLISDRVYANSAGYVRNVEVLSSREERGVMKVALRAEVGTAQLDKDLQAVQALVKRFGSPKLVILTQEQAFDNKGVATSSEVMAAALTAGFKQDGWTIIDPHFAAGKVRLTSGVSFGTPEAKEIGQLTKADYILYGAATFHFEPQDAMTQGFFFVSGDYNFALFDTENGLQVGKITGKFMNGTELAKNKGTYAVSYERTAHDLAEAQSKEVVAQMRARAIEHLRSSEQNGRRLVMNVAGLADYAAAQAFKRMLEEELTGIRNVDRREFTPARTQFELIFVGTADDLAGALDSRQFKKKKLSVTSVTADTVELSIAK